MKRYIKYISIGITLVTIFIISSFTIFYYHNFKQELSIEDEKLKDGDLILRRGRSVESMAVCLLDNNHDFSHIGIIARESDIPYVVHVVPENPGFVLKEKTHEFLERSKASHYAVYRPLFKKHQLEEAAHKALSFYREKIVFDNHYDMNSDSALYCTELVIKAFKSVNIELYDIVPQEIHLVNGNYKIFLPGSFLKSSCFTRLMTE